MIYWEIKWNNYSERSTSLLLSKVRVGQPGVYKGSFPTPSFCFVFLKKELTVFPQLQICLSLALEPEASCVYVCPAVSVCHPKRCWGRVSDSLCVYNALINASNLSVAPLWPCWREYDPQLKPTMKAKPTISVLVKPIHIKRNKHQLKMLTSGRCVCVLRGQASSDKCQITWLQWVPTLAP